MARSKTDIELSTSDANLYVNIAKEAIDIGPAEDFKVWARTSVRKLFPHEMLIAGVAQQTDKQVAVDRLLPVGFPMPFIEAVADRRGSFACPTLESWFRQGQPQLYEPNSTRYSIESLNPSREFERYDLKNVAAHGISDVSGKVATYFSFSQIPKSLTQRHADLLELLVPHLHHAYIRATSGSTKIPECNQRATQMTGHPSLDWTHGFRLTAREHEILYWIGMGNTNDEISRTLHRARDTVKHQVSSVLKKLNVSTRQEAVALAIRNGLLPERRGQTIDTK